MREDAPDDPWTLTVQSYGIRDVDQSIALCERAWAKDSREDVLVLCTAAMSRQVRTARDAERLRAFFERHKTKYEASAKGLTAEADALSGTSFRKADKNAAADAFALSMANY